MPWVPSSGGARTPAWVDDALGKAAEAGLGAIILVIPVDRAMLLRGPRNLAIATIVDTVQVQIAEQVDAVRAGVPVAMREPGV